MSAQPPPVVARKPSGVRVMMMSGKDSPAGGLPLYTNIRKDNGASVESNHHSPVNAEREVELLNHCFDDVERFMSRLQQAAEAQSVLNQRKKKRGKKNKKKLNQEDDLLTTKASPPTEEEFVHLFQKFKYIFCLLDRLKSSISQPDAPELLHHIFVPLRLMLLTTGGPALGASVVSPALTSGAVSLLQEHLTDEEKLMWTSLGTNWTSPRSQLSSPVPPYTPVFLDGWQPPCDSAGRPFEDPIEAQHKQEAYSERLQALSVQKQSQPTAESPGIHKPTDTHEVDENGLPPEGERLFCCSYDFVARNSSELSVLQGETLEVVESSKRWWKCRNRYDQIGFVPFNILEPLSALNSSSPVRLRESKNHASASRTKYFSYAPTSPVGFSPATSPTIRPQSMVLPSSPIQADDSDRVLIMNDELLQRLAEKRGSIRPAVTPRSTDMSSPLDYHSSASEVEAWLTAKGFNQQTTQSLGILTGAQLFALNKDELRTVSPEDGARVYSQIMVQKALLEDVRKASELEKAMEKQKQKIALDS
ncbi:epidermal growth factor receptor kinase substrate 8-like protein 1a isoform X2 [Gouania willdenowi]|uniref:Epidermal growth factor receptor kinase substrate 8-like protein 1 n=1 Tax=Gouania willdenowi TaxID=441366 RepID=A0A8C5EUW2_GOUWI|nr:epidermal growth factor receptor kinase substrate 8-like protein 1 isoform X2 [Gouania willdenowi]